MAKFYYEVLTRLPDDRKDKRTLIGPVNGIHRCKASNGGETKYRYVQIIDDKPVAAFTRDEMVCLPVDLSL
jgi:hypothetical protein